MEIDRMSSSRNNLEKLLDESATRANAFTRKIMPNTMTGNEAAAFINDKGNSAIVATVRKNGSPHTAWNPIAFVDERLYTYADPSSVCYKNMKRDGRVSVAITGKSDAIFIQGEASDVGKVNQSIDTLLARIFSVVKGWIPPSSYNYASLAECQASIFEIEISKILTFKT
jgi:uncharacterized pyridoxamine 5'-phosphate oxidase family protein